MSKCQAFTLACRVHSPLKKGFMLEKAHTGAANSDLPHSVVQNVYRGFLQRCLERERPCLLCLCGKSRCPQRKAGFATCFQTGTASKNGLVARASSEDCIPTSHDPIQSTCKYSIYMDFFYSNKARPFPFKSPIF